MSLSFGPQHPAAHGILKIGLRLSGEVVLRADPQFGLLHRGSEKLMEARSYLRALPYLDRDDYVANLIQEHAFVAAVETLGGPDRAPAQRITAARVLLDELSRVLNHLLTVSAVSMDMGAMGPLFWAFEEREAVMELLERASGARMHTALYRPFEQDLSWADKAFFTSLAGLVLRSARAVSGAFLGLLNNRALKTRLAGVGVFSPAKVDAYAVTGVIARSAGRRRDLRLDPNSGYAGLSVRTFLGRRADNYDRFVLRVKEVVESLRVVTQVATAWAPAQAGLGRASFVSMEGVIAHFKANSGGDHAPRGLAYSAVESPKGEVGCTVVSAGAPCPHRVKLRSPVAHNLNLIPSAAAGATLADFVATFCSLDVVMGEIDR